MCESRRTGSKLFKKWQENHLIEFKNSSETINALHYIQHLFDLATVFIRKSDICLIEQVDSGRSMSHSNTCQRPSQIFSSTEISLAFSVLAKRIDWLIRRSRVPVEIKKFGNV